MHTQSKYRLLVVRLGAMGDILHALPAVTALRQAHPSWIIDWVVEPRWQALLRAETTASKSSPVVDRLHLAATREWRKAPFSGSTIHQINTLRRDLQAVDYDAVLDLQGSIRSAVLGWFSRCRRRIGESAPRESAARLLFTEHVETTGSHVIDQDIELASAIFCDELEPTVPMLPIDPAAEVWADGILSPGSAPGVLINPGAGWGAKRWPVERYAAVAQALIAEGCRVFVNAGPGEEPLSASILQAVPTATPLSGSLVQLIALTRRIALCIAGDTGPLHLACALQKPVVGIYGPTDPARNGPYGTRFTVLRSPLSRRDHTRHAAPEAGLLTIEPAAVLQAARALLANEDAE